MAGDLIVLKVDQARALLAEAKDATEAKRIADVARAAEDYARRQRLGDDCIRYATAVKIDALALMGEFLRAKPPNPGARGKPGPGRGKNGVRVANPVSSAASPPTLADLGIGKHESADARALAEMQQAAPDLYEQVRDGQSSVAAARAEKKRRERRQKSAGATPAGGRQDSPAGPLWTVDQADCLEWLRSRPADSLDLVFGSPPYELARLYLEDGRDHGIARGTDEWVAWMVEVYEAALRCCDGLVAFVVAGQTKNYAWTASPCLLVAALRARGIAVRLPPLYRRVGIPGSGGPDWLRNDYEFVVCATRGGRLPWSDNTAMGHAPRCEPGGAPSHREQDGTRVNDPVAYATPEERANEGPHRARRRKGRVYRPPERSNPGNVIDCGAVGGGNMGDRICHENEAPFPEYLAEFFVRSFCRPGGVVCDPFSGSGTTAAVAKRCGRRFAGCDLRASQVKLSLRRLANAQPPLPLEV